MSKIAVIVSNPCTGDARVIKMANAAREAGHDVHVFATIGKNTQPYEVKDGVTYHRLEWNPGKILRRSLVLSLVNKISKRFCSFLIRAAIPFIKYRLFSNVFAEHIANIKPDIIHAHDLICLPTAFGVKKIHRAKIVYDASSPNIIPNNNLLYSGSIDKITTTL